jgi:hypothetical protein
MQAKHPQHKFVASGKVELYKATLSTRNISNQIVAPSHWLLVIFFLKRPGKQFCEGFDNSLFYIVIFESKFDKRAQLSTIL